MEVTMERYIHNANIEHYLHLIVESESDPARDQGRYAILRTLLAEELAKDNCLPPHGSPSDAYCGSGIAACVTSGAA
jgi:hypothetical protein